MTQPLPTRKIGSALIVAALADAFQLPSNAAVASLAMALPAEMLIVALDCFTMVLESSLLGFHWLFLPSFLVEAVPCIDLLPTWTATIAYLLWRSGRRPLPDAFLRLDASAEGETKHDTSIHANSQTEEK